MQDSVEDAKAALLDLTCERLRRLASRMLKNYPRLKRWSDTDEVLRAGGFGAVAKNEIEKLLLDPVVAGTTNTLWRVTPVVAFFVAINSLCFLSD